MKRYKRLLQTQPRLKKPVRLCFIPPVCLSVSVSWVSFLALCSLCFSHSTSFFLIYLVFFSFAVPPFCHLLSSFSGRNGGLIIQPSPLPAGASYRAGVAFTWQAVQAGRDHGVGCTGDAGRRGYPLQVRGCRWHHRLFVCFLCICVKMVHTASVLARSLLEAYLLLFMACRCLL